MSIHALTARKMPWLQVVQLQDNCWNCERLKSAWTSGPGALLQSHLAFRKWWFSKAPRRVNRLQTVGHALLAYRPEFCIYATALGYSLYTCLQMYDCHTLLVKLHLGSLDYTAVPWLWESGFARLDGPFANNKISSWSRRSPIGCMLQFYPLVLYEHRVHSCNNADSFACMASNDSQWLVRSCTKNFRRWKGGFERIPSKPPGLRSWSVYIKSCWDSPNLAFSQQTRSPVPARTPASIPCRSDAATNKHWTILHLRRYPLTVLVFNIWATTESNLNQVMTAQSDCGRAR